MIRNPLNLSPKEPDKHCNARTPKGYCGHKAGFRTAHQGEGRCWLHGGNTPILKPNANVHLQTIYTKMLPTTLAIELAEIKNDPLFTTLFEEYALLKLIVQAMLSDLPADIASIYGRPVCSECKKDLEVKSRASSDNGEKSYVVLAEGWDGQQKRLSKLISTIESMSRVFEKVSKHEERQKRFIPVSELEAIVVQWGKVLMKYFGDHPNIAFVQQEIMESGFFRHPGEQDQEKLAKFREVQTKIKNKHINSKRDRGRQASMAEIVAEVVPEAVDFEIVDNKSNRKVVEHDGVYVEDDS